MKRTRDIEDELVLDAPPPKKIKTE